LDYLSIWRTPSGETNVGMHLRTREPRYGTVPSVLGLDGVALAWTEPTECG